MAEPDTPETPENRNGEEREPTRLNRGVTLRGRVTANTWGGVAFFGLALVAALWVLLGGGDEERDEQQQAGPLRLEDAPALDPPQQEEQPPPQLTIPQVLQHQQAETPAIDPLAEERLRMLLARVQRLQREQDQRRRSNMLAFSSGAGIQAAAAAAATVPPPPLDNAALTQEADNSIRLGDVGPVGDTQAVQARVLRTTGYTITEGTVIAGVLETAINSTLPGMVRAINAADVYSHDGTQLLIPKGSRLVGRYQSSVRRGQVRIFVLWTRIIRADGLSVLINSPGTDPLGRAGLEGDVDTHFFQIFGAAILLSIIDGGIEVGLEMAREQGSGQRTVIGNQPRGLDRAAELALQDSIRIPPTIHVDQGTRINILVARDLDFEAVELARAHGN